MIFRKLLSYLMFWKSQESADGKKPSSYLRMMHGINKISILMFLLAMIYMIYKYYR